MKHEIWIDIPQESELIGTRTDGSRVCIIYETQPNYRPIGFCLHNVADNDDDDEENKNQYNIKCYDNN